MGRRKSGWRCYASVLAVAVVVPVAAAMAGQKAPSSVRAGLAGTLRKKITDATWHKNRIFYETGGHWAIVITTAGRTSLFAPPGQPKETLPLTTMHVAASSGSATFVPTADHFCRKNASYRWKASGTRLAFTVAEDGCDARRVLLTVGNWTRA
jgi:hypothetical protein